MAAPEIDRNLKWVERGRFRFCKKQEYSRKCPFRKQWPRYLSGETTYNSKKGRNVPDNQNSVNNKIPRQKKVGKHINFWFKGLLLEGVDIL